MKRLFLLAAVPALFASSAALAQQASPVGLWKNIDDESGKPKALIRITESNGVLSGKIEKLFRAPSEDQNPKCDKCEGELKNQPILGMTILSGMKRDGDEYNGGNILDPNNGKVYHSKLELKDSGKKLSVRGYIGIPLLGRSQTWLREE
ncbi:MAG TPA: DUF2147 domain-containing protein [Burkholderiaceae bacterium]